jgi:hypothetical protein
MGTVSNVRFVGYELNFNNGGRPSQAVRQKPVVGMSPSQLIEIPLLNGHVGVTACRHLLIEDLQSAIAAHPQYGVDLRVFPLGNVGRHPIAWLWATKPRLAVCLPDAFAYVLIEFIKAPPLEDVLHRWIWVHRHGGPVELIPELQAIELVEFLPMLAPVHQKAGTSLRSAIDRECKDRDRIVSLAVQAGLYQMNDCLDESHECSQAIEGEGSDGDYWHAIMHRREPDYGNAKYWFRQVGRHPVFETLTAVAKSVIEHRHATELDKLTNSDWDPFLFVDLCQKHARDENSPSALALREIQGWEMALLLVASAT